MIRIMKLFQVVVVMVVLGLSLMSQVQALSKVAPTLPFKILGETSSKTLENYRGKVVLVNFWATWCPPCQAEIPHLSKLQSEFGKMNFQILGFSVDASSADINEYLSQNKLSYPVAIANAKLQAAFGGISSIPAAFIIDRNGKIVAHWIGYRGYADLRSAILKYLK
jgi:cytochrome c biogenesis protein CcmG, thiol:disulfide interchange protein DsbE